MNKITEFDADRWCEELGKSLDEFASTVQPIFRYEFPDEEPLPNVLPIPDVHELAQRRYRKLAERIQHDPSAAEVFEGAGLRFNDGDRGNVVAALRHHPAILRALNKSDANLDGAVFLLYPFGSADVVELKDLALQLARLTFKTNGMEAARLLNRFLTQGEARSLGGCEIILIWGLRSCRRIDIGEGVFLAPYEEIAAIYGPHPIARHDGIQQRASSMARPHRLFHEAPEYVTALVREFTWGPAIAPASEHSSELSGLPVVRLLASDRDSEPPPPEDAERIRDFLTIATEKHQLSGGWYVPVEQWLTEIHKNYRYSWNQENTLGDEWWETNDLFEVGAKTFMEMAEGWVNYKGKREQLDSAIRQLATLYYRRGRSQVNDQILDAATALEVMYALDAAEITYKLRVRAGFFLGNNSDERQGIFNRVGKFYEARSAVIHGGTRRRRVAPGAALSDGLAVARNTLIALLRLGHAPNWDHMVMSAGEDMSP